MEVNEEWWRRRDSARRDCQWSHESSAPRRPTALDHGRWRNYSYDITGLQLNQTTGNTLFLRLIGNGNRQVQVTAVNIEPIFSTEVNPPVAETCGLDMVLVIDTSGSINATELAQMKDAMELFVAAFLPDTPTEIAVVNFDTAAAVQQGFTTDVTAINTAINAGTSGGFTNWDDAFFDARGLFPHRPNPDLIVFSSDGNPTARFGHPPNPATVTEAGNEYNNLAPAVEESDIAQANDASIIALGIGDDSQPRQPGRGLCP